MSAKLFINSCSSRPAEPENIKWLVIDAVPFVSLESLTLPATNITFTSTIGRL